jgi:4-hydroxy-L-threonine phosphate dehydrogenase PdxA
MTNKIIIVAGDPNSINSEIIYKSWKKLNKKIKKKIYLIANYKLIFQQFKKLNIKTKIVTVNNIDDCANIDNLKIINIPLKFKNPFNVDTNLSSKYVLQSLDLAHKLAVSKKIKGFVNCPINKKLISSAKKIGVTELLASKCQIKDHSEVMMIYNKKLSVVPLTTHIKIKNISKKIKVDLIVRKISTLNKYYKKIFKKRPKIGILGLNPHNSELSKNSEEYLRIIPAIKVLKKKYFKINGPLVADTIFINDYKKYDVIVGMYHDQVLGPFKTLFHFNAINITLGLNYLRVSPDHGPAAKLVKKNIADYSSLLECVKFIDYSN